MRHIEKIEFKKEGILEQRERQQIDSIINGREQVIKTQRYYEKIKKRSTSKNSAHSEKSKKSEGKQNNTSTMVNENMTFHP